MPQALQHVKQLQSPALLQAALCDSHIGLCGESSLCQVLAPTLCEDRCSVSCSTGSRLSRVELSCSPV